LLCAGEIHLALSSSARLLESGLVFAVARDFAGKLVHLFCKCRVRADAARQPVAVRVPARSIFFPASERGPVLFCALRLFAAICRSVATVVIALLRRMYVPADEHFSFHSERLLQCAHNEPLARRSSAGIIGSADLSNKVLTSLSLVSEESSSATVPYPSAWLHRLVFPTRDADQV
jgi:hypothetical protein